MANFINKKEEVIQISLTNYGKSIFSRGEFSPVFYSFYDDDILYDGTYGGIKEIQNNIVDRIQDTQRMSNFTSTKTTFPNNQQTVSTTLGNTEFDEIMPAVASYLTPLGTSSPFSDFAPAWEITVLTPESGFTTGSIVYTVLSASLNVEYLTAGDEIPTLVLHKDEKIILDVLELNTIFKVNGNYNIEVFKQPNNQIDSSDTGLDRLLFPESKKSSSDTVAPREDFRVPSNLRRNDMATSFGASEAQLIERYEPLTIEDVPYFLNIAVDTAISVSPPPDKKSLYSNVIGDNRPISSCDD